MAEKTERRRVAFRVAGFDCASCAKVVERVVGRLDGVEDVRASVLTDAVYIDFDPARTTEDDIKRAIAKTRYKPIYLEG